MLLPPDPVLLPLVAELTRAAVVVSLEEPEEPDDWTVPTRLLEELLCCEAEFTVPTTEPDPELCVEAAVLLSALPESGFVPPAPDWPPDATPALPPPPPPPPPLSGCAKLLPPMRPELVRVEGVEFCCVLVGLQMQTHCPEVPSWGAR